MENILLRKLIILGTRGIPAQHGGFETFAEQLSLFLVQRGWHVTVYCQEEGDGEIKEDSWNGVCRVLIPVKKAGAIGTVIFDWKATLHAASRKEGIMLSLGYNTAIFFLVFRLKGRKNIVNMDGIEWKRMKWNWFEKTWLYFNEKCGSFLGDHLVADHPKIKDHLMALVPGHKITTIPYSSDKVESADTVYLDKFDLQPNKYVLLIARPEPENLILDIVRAYSRKVRGWPLVILGQYNIIENAYHRKVVENAGPEVMFIGPQYHKSLVQALRFYCRLYIHGHTVGGTNPSLVEALGAGSAVLAHDNHFNRWVAGQGAQYFLFESDCAEMFDKILDDDNLLGGMKVASRKQHEARFTHKSILEEYEKLLLSQYSLS